VRGEVSSSCRNPKARPTTGRGIACAKALRVYLLRMGSEVVSLSTERLLLRPMRAADVDATVAALDDLEVSRRLARVPHPYTERDARLFLEIVERGRADGAMDHFVIVRADDDDDRPIGAIGVHGEPGATVAEVGYWIARPHWGNGYAREALAAVVRRSFFTRTPPLTLLTSHVHETNRASMRVLVACGFVETGSRIASCAATGVDVPAIEFELHRG
jgi:ribosomal-protein-alanine N-acetyltransferase